MRENHWLVASCTPPTGDLAPNPGMCPSQEWNQWPFTLQAGSHSTEPYHQGQDLYFFRVKYRNLILFLSWYHVSIILCDLCGLALVSGLLKKQTTSSSLQTLFKTRDSGKAIWHGVWMGQQSRSKSWADPVPESEGEWACCLGTGAGLLSMVMAGCWGFTLFFFILSYPKWSRPANFLSVLGEVWQKQFSERLEKSGAHFIFYFLQQKLVVWGIFLRAMLCWLRRRMTQKNQYCFSYNFLFFPAYLFFLSF